MSGGGGNNGVTGMLPMAAALAATVMTDGAATPFLAEEMGVSAGTAAALGGTGIGALAGGVTGALTGQNVGRSALMGGLGGLGLGASGSFMGAGDALGSTGSLMSGLGGTTAGASGDVVPGVSTDTGIANVANANGATPTSVNDPITNMYNSGALSGGAGNSVVPNPTDPSFMSDPIGWMKAHPIQTAMAGAGAYGLSKMGGSGSLTQPNYLPKYNPVTAQQMGLGRTMASNYQPQTNQMYYSAEGGQVPSYASGGDINVAPGSVATQGVAPADLQQQQTQLPSQVQSLMSQYNVTPAEAQQTLTSLGVGQPATRMASGGIAGLGGYASGGNPHLLKGPGDGMSDNIPASIDGKQPARLADGEFVVPADVVSHLGNGSTDAGAKRLHDMMDKVRKARTGRKTQGKQIKADKFLPA